MLAGLLFRREPFFQSQEPENLAQLTCVAQVVGSAPLLAYAQDKGKGRLSNEVSLHAYYAQI